jgi:DNA-binding response OmpR family regulator
MEPTILIVDDNRGLLETFGAALQQQYKVRLAANLNEAYEQLANGDVDLVLLDLHLQPRGNDRSGFEILKAIRRNESRPIGVIMFTVEEDVATTVEAMKLGADYYLSKNCSDDELLAVVKKVIDNTRLQKNFLNISALESKVDQFRKLAIELADENKDLKVQIEQLSGKRKSRTTSLDIENYKAICGAVAHSLKGEFVHIGQSLRGLRELAGNSSDIQEECDMIARSIQYSQILLRRLLDYLDTGQPSWS